MRRHIQTHQTKQKKLRAREDHLQGRKNGKCTAEKQKREREKKKESKTLEIRPPRTIFILLFRFFYFFLLPVSQSVRQSSHSHLGNNKYYVLWCSVDGRRKGAKVSGLDNTSTKIAYYCISFTLLLLTF